MNLRERLIAENPYHRDRSVIGGMDRHRAYVEGVDTALAAVRSRMLSDEAVGIAERERFRVVGCEALGVHPMKCALSAALDRVLGEASDD